jgi:hypothetical protein
MDTVSLASIVRTTKWGCIGRKYKILCTFGFAFSLATVGFQTFCNVCLRASRLSCDQRVDNNLVTPNNFSYSADSSWVVDCREGRPKVFCLIPCRVPHAVVFEHRCNWRAVAVAPRERLTIEDYMAWVSGLDTLAVLLPSPHKFESKQQASVADATDI